MTGASSTAMTDRTKAVAPVPHPVPADALTPKLPSLSASGMRFKRISELHRLVAAAAIILAGAGCGYSVPVPSPRNAGTVVSTSVEPAFNIIKVEGEQSKDIIEIRLREKVAREAIVAYCREIHRTKSGKAKRTVIWVYMPTDESVGSLTGRGSPWAVVEFDPDSKRFNDCQVRIMGFTIEEEAELKAIPSSPGTEVVGRWLQDDNSVGGLLTIFRSQGLIYLELQRGPTRGLIEEIVEFKHPECMAFRRKEVSKAGDHYLITANGNLLIADVDGVIASCKKVD
jgi:hypothetical protein